MTARIVKFQSLSELSNYLERPILGAPSDGPSSEDMSVSPSWANGLSYKQAKEIVQNGGYWQEGTKLLNKINAEYEQAMNLGRGPAIELMPAGFAPDVAEYLSGSPTCMFNQTDDGLGVASKPIVKVGVNVSMTSWVSGEYAMNRGAAIMSLIDLLESNGQRCELWSLNRTRSSLGVLDPDTKLEKMCHDVLIKPAHRIWDPATVAFMMCHPASLRRIGFRLMEVEPGWERVCSGGCYGRNLVFDDIEDQDDWDIYFDALGYRGENPTLYETPEAAIKHIEELSKGILPDDLRMEV